MILEICLLILFALFLMPVCIYLAVKFGTFGYLVAKKKFEEKEKDNGYSERT